TSLTFDVAREQDRFEFSPLRDSDSTRMTAGLKFEPFALIKGSARIGYRDFQPVRGEVPSFQGITADVDLSYTLSGMSKFGVQVGRDVQYSFEINQPYYVQTGISASIAQQIFGPVDVAGRIGTQRLDYRERRNVVAVAAGRTDLVRSYGIGVGYHMSRDL